MRVSVIIVNYNGALLLNDCLQSLSKQTFKDFEIIFVDNASSDNSYHIALEILLKIDIPFKLISLSPYNKGFAGGNNEGLKFAEGEYIALLNNDAIADSLWLEELVRAMEKYPDAGICASKILKFNTNFIDSAGMIFSRFLKGFNRGEWDLSHLYNKEEYIFGACAAAAIYRKKMLEEIGFFDDDFFIIHEDVDISFRAQLAGWKVVFVPGSIIYHKTRSTIKHMSNQAIYYSLRNIEFVRIKNLPFLIFLKCLPWFLIYQFSEFLYFALKHKKISIYFRAKYDAIKDLRKMLHKRREIMVRRTVSNKYISSHLSSPFEKYFLKKMIKKFFIPMLAPVIITVFPLMPGYIANPIDHFSILCFFIL